MRRAFLHDALADKITLDDLAEHAALDKFHPVRAFRSEVGLRPYEYRSHLRVSRARELLRCGVLVAEAAQAVGLCDESQLHRHFRRIAARIARRCRRRAGRTAWLQQLLHRLGLPVRALTRQQHEIITVPHEATS